DNSRREEENEKRETRSRLPWQGGSSFRGGRSKTSIRDARPPTASPLSIGTSQRGHDDGFPSVAVLTDGRRAPRGLHVRSEPCGRQAGGRLLWSRRSSSPAGSPARRLPRGRRRPRSGGRSSPAPSRCSRASPPPADGRWCASPPSTRRTRASASAGGSP